MKYARRTDANQGEIVRTLEEMGALVVDCSHVGRGYPDLTVLWRGQWLLAECKDGEKSPSRRKLTAEQMLFHARANSHGGKVFILNNVDDALKMLGARRGA